MRDINTVAGAATAGVNPFGAHLPNNEATLAMLAQYPILASGAGYMGVFGSGNFYVFEKSGTWIGPSGVTKIRRRVVGGGSGPGGGGGYAHDTITVTPGSSATVVVATATTTSSGGTSSMSMDGAKVISATGGNGSGGGSGYPSSGSTNPFSAKGGSYGGGAGSQLGNGGDGGGGGGGGVRHSSIGKNGASAFSPSGHNAFGIPQPVANILVPRRFPFDHFLGGSATGAGVISGDGAGGFSPTTGNGGRGGVGGGGASPGGGGGGCNGGTTGGDGGIGGGGGGLAPCNGFGGPGLVIAEW